MKSPFNLSSHAPPTRRHHEEPVGRRGDLVSENSYEIATATMWPRDDAKQGLL